MLRLLLYLGNRSRTKYLMIGFDDYWQSLNYISVLELRSDMTTA